MLRYFVVCVAFFALSFAYEPFIVQFQWNSLNYTWPSAEAYSTAVKDGAYVEKNSIISGINFWKDKMYLTVPRLKNGVPATLTVTSASVVNGSTAPLLEPYPNWDLQKIGDCSALQNVKNIEIDPKGRMWVLDNGRVATMTLESQNKCPAKLVILDLENDGKVLRSYDFPDDVVNSNSGILRNIVLDHNHGGVAYITDSDQLHPGLIVYSLANNTSWKVYHESMNWVSNSVGFKLENINFSDEVNIVGIALTPASNDTNDREVYFSALTSFNIFVVKTQALIDAKDKTGQEREQEIAKHVRSLGRKPSQSEGMAMSNTGALYFGLLADDAIAIWDSKVNTAFVTGQRLISRDHWFMQWPGNFAFDNNGGLWCISNRMHRYVSDKINVEEPNYRALKMKVDTLNYQYYPDGKAPELPEISARSADTSVNHGFPRLGK